eukprot:535900_1
MSSLAIETSTKVTAPLLLSNKTHLNRKWCKICVIMSFFVLILLTGIIIFVIMSNKETNSPNAGTIGVWPMYGGNLQNQQRSPYESLIKINKANIANITIDCIYESFGGLAFSGYPTIDNDNNVYFTDMSGYIHCVNLDLCELCWSQNIGNLLGYDNNNTITISTVQSLTLFIDSSGNKGALFGAPTSRGTFGSNTNYPDNDGCYAVAVHLKNGTLFWKIDLRKDSVSKPINNHLCSSHGFYIDGKYGYGGFAQSATYSLENGSKFIGRYIKIDIDKHEIINTWYPFDINLTTKLDEYNKTYAGIGIYNSPAIIDDYLIFGTSNLQQTPNIIEDCLSGVISVPDNICTYNLDMCGSRGVVIMLQIQIDIGIVYKHIFLLIV